MVESDVDDVCDIAEESQKAVLVEQIVLPASKRSMQSNYFECIIMAARDREVKLMNQWSKQSVIIYRQAGQLSELE